MKFLKTLSLLLFIVVCFVACEEDDVIVEPGINFEIPTTYSFQRDRISTVSFGGQTTRIKMGEELIEALEDFEKTEEDLIEMFANQRADGFDADPFMEADLNESNKSIRSKVAASLDFYFANTVESAAVKADFSKWIGDQVSEVFPKRNELAVAGISGQIADDTSVRYVNGFGLEYKQVINKSLIGALMVDQMLNNYLSEFVLDADDNRDANDEMDLEEGKNYTTMEHKWDEAYGYLFGNSSNIVEPLMNLGEDDSFLNKYIGAVNSDSDFFGIGKEVWEAFKKGRSAIVAGEYKVRDEQVKIIREKVSMVIGVRAVYYLQQGKLALQNGNTGGAFHDLSEGLGFVYSLQFTRKGISIEPYFSRAEVMEYIDKLLDEDNYGFWGVNADTLDEISVAIASRFDFTVNQAAQ